MLNKLGRAADTLLDNTIFFSFTNIGYHLRRPLRTSRDDERPISGLHCLVTGANAGLGKVVATALAERGAVVHMLCRNRERGAAAADEIRRQTGSETVELHIVDMSIQADIRAFVAGFGPERVDVLVNNAGVLLNERRESAEGIEMTFATNVIGPYLLTELLLPRLRRSAAPRVINVTSGGMYLARVHARDPQFEHRDYDGAQAYAESKRAEVLLTTRWAAEWAADGIAVAAVHPGWAATPGVSSSLPRFEKVVRPLLRTPAQGADGIVWLCVSADLTDYPNGAFWFDRRIRSPHKRGVKRNTAEQIAAYWEKVRAVAGLSLTGGAE